MSRIGKCYICNKSCDVVEKMVTFSNVHCECCKLGFHQHKISVCIDDIKAKVTGPTKIYYTGSVHTVPMEVLTDHSDLSATEMKKFIKQEYNNNGI